MSLVGYKFFHHTSYLGLVKPSLLRPFRSAHVPSDVDLWRPKYLRCQTSVCLDAFVDIHAEVAEHDCDQSVNVIRQLSS
jgi:hypothetical protein